MREKVVRVIRILRFNFSKKMVTNLVFHATGPERNDKLISLPDHQLPVDRGTFTSLGHACVDIHGRTPQMTGRMYISFDS